MCIKNAMELSLNGDTFAALKEDFDSILAQTLGNMESKGADEAVITLKLGVSLEKQSFVRNEEPEELTKPSFKHDISSVMQVKNKKSGSLSGDYELVWDDDEKKYVMRKITNGQLTMFVEDGEEVEQYQEEDDTYVTEPVILEAHAEEESDSEDITAFDWLSQFVDKQMKITEAMGNYTVRTDDGKVVLTSASEPDSVFHCDSEPDSVFHCDAEILAKHLEHSIVCAGYGGDELYQITIECEDCLETLFSLRLNCIDDEDDEDVSEEFEEYMAEGEEPYEEAPTDDEEEPASDEDAYDYSTPEETEEE